MVVDHCYYAVFFPCTQVFNYSLYFLHNDVLELRLLMFNVCIDSAVFLGLLAETVLASMVVDHYYYAVFFSWTQVFAAAYLFCI
jgi:uncharacterized membrane protein YedE/YeeE